MRKETVIINGILTEVLSSELIDGGASEFYLPKVNGIYQIDEVKENEKTLSKLIEDGESLVTDYIQAKVDLLNDELGTKFGSIHNVANYMHSATYPHAVRCKDLWEWNERVWVKARAEQTNAVANNLTAEEFTAILDTVI